MQPHEAHIPYILAFLADYNLYGCQWIDFGSEFHERTSLSSNRTVYEGLEVDIEASHILNRQGTTQNIRHSQLFEPEDTSIAMSSLAELRSADRKRRDDLGTDPWTDLKLLPAKESVTRALSWKWERSQDHDTKLKELLNSSSTNSNGDPLLHDWSHLPTAAELVRSTYSLELASYNVPDIRQRPCIPSQPHPSQISNQKSQFTQMAAPKPSVLDELQIRSQDSYSISTAANEASFVLGSQFTPHTSISGQNIANAFGISSGVLLKATAPTTAVVANTTGITTSTQAYYSNPDDASPLPFTFAGEDLLLKTLKPKDLPPFEIAASETITRLAAHLADEDGNRVVPELRNPGLLKRFELATPAPTYSQVDSWQKETQMSKHSSSANTSAPFQFESLEEPDTVSEEMLLLAIEVFTEVRPGKAPNATYDSICAVFWQLSGKPRSVPWAVPHNSDPPQTGIITTSAALGEMNVSTLSLSIKHVETELMLLDAVIQMTRSFNPDILTGYEISYSSWGYARARYKQLNPDGADTFYEQLSRIKLPRTPSWKLMTSGTGAPTEETETVRGRHILSLWNILRREVTLSKHTLEYVVYHTLHERTPHFEFDDLWKWWSSGDAIAMSAVVRYWTRRVAYVLRLFAHFEIVSRTCEKSRIIGLDFMSSLTRGSQFQVEAVLCRISRQDNFVLLSPTKRQVGQQNALEYIPLVMEPMSAFYTDPVCVLDFRSLYPSIVIAFNLCYSTCIGRLDLWRGRNKLGVKQDHSLSPDVLKAIGTENIYVAPNGIGYVTPKVRRSLLAHMLGEILESRFMLNDSKKSNRSNKRYQRNLNSQQLALKFIANVTYGYTSASFSGRMPCAELADSIVLTGRELLQWCIQQIEGCEKWNIQPQVVYGDTDSLFVRLPNVTREQAFRIGREISEMITVDTPDPILLKLEKVYSPCVLLTKKRYVGNAYEDAEPGAKPKFDAKGTETIRRDGTPIIQKLEKRALQILFDSADLSRVKSYLQNQWRLILTGRVPIQDFCFAQEVKLGHYKTTNGMSNLPGGAVVSLKKLAKDDGMEPLYRERVPFVITAGAPGSRINDRAVSPEEVISNPGLKIDAEYYIQKTIIPPLERLFNMIGANVKVWYQTMSRTVRTTTTSESKFFGGNTIPSFFSSDTCACCLENRRRSPQDILCGKCRDNEPRSRYILTSRTSLQQRTLASTAAACRLCSELPPSTIIHGVASPIARHHPCTSLDCPVFYEREQARGDTTVLTELVNSI